MSNRKCWPLPSHVWNPDRLPWVPSHNTAAELQEQWDAATTDYRLQLRPAANSMLTADTRRLKWLEATGVTVSKIECDDGRHWFEVAGRTWFEKAPTLRAAIDKGMAREQAPLHDRADDDASG